MLAQSIACIAVCLHVKGVFLNRKDCKSTTLIGDTERHSKKETPQDSR